MPFANAISQLPALAALKSTTKIPGVDPDEADPNDQNVAFTPAAITDWVFKHGADVASDSTIDLDAATGDLVDVTGTTTITAITLAEGRSRLVRFTGILTLTNGASLVLPGGANITTAAGDFALFRGYAAGVVRCAVYVKKNGKATIGPLAADITDSGTAGRAAVQSETAADLRTAAGLGSIATQNAGTPILGNVQVTTLFYDNTVAALSALNVPRLASTAGGGAYPFDNAGNLLIEGRSSAARDILFATQGTLKAVLTGTGLWGIGTTSPDRLSHAEVSDAVTAAVSFGQRRSHITSGTAAAGFGIGVEDELENASGTNVVAARFETVWRVATNAAETAEHNLYVKVAGSDVLVAKFCSVGVMQPAGTKRVTSQFDKTNNTLANVTGLSVNVEAGKTYKFRAWLDVTAQAAGGHKYAIAGTATATVIMYRVKAYRDSTAAYVIANARQTALGGAAGITQAFAGGETTIEGYITVNAAGTLTVQFAQNVTDATPSSVLVGSMFEVTEVA